MTVATADRTVATHTAETVTGVSFRQIDYWDRCGYLGVRGRVGSGHRREWTLADCQRIAAIGAVKAALGRSVEIEVAIAVIDGQPLDQATVGHTPVDISLSVDLAPVYQAVAAEWIRQLAVAA